MAFGLPSKGQQDWDDEVSNSIQSIKDTADDAHSKAVVAENTATQAATTATEAKSAAEAALSQVSSSTGTLGSAVSAAETAKAAAEAAQAAAEAVGTTNDEVIAGQITDDASQTSAALEAWVADMFIKLPEPTGTDDTAAIQAILDTAQPKFVTARRGATYIISKPLYLNDFTMLDATGATFQRKTGTRGNLLRNTGYSGPDRPDGSARNANITVIGGLWDKNATEGSTNYDLHYMVFHNVDGIEVRDAHYRDVGTGSKFCLLFANVTNYKAKNLTFGAPGVPVNSDGVHVHGPASHGLISGMFGATGDDFVSITPAEYENYQLDAGGGDVSDLVIEKIFPSDAHSGVALVGGQNLDGTVQRRIEHVTIRDVYGTVTASHGIRILSDPANHGTNGGFIDDINIENVSVSCPLAYNTIYAGIDPATPGSIGTIRARNVTLRDADDFIELHGRMDAFLLDGFAMAQGVRQAVAMVDVDTDATIGALTVRNVRGSGAVDKSSGDVVKQRGNVTTLTVEDVDFAEGTTVVRLMGTTTHLNCSRWRYTSSYGVYISGAAEAPKINGRAIKSASTIFAILTGATSSAVIAGQDIDVTNVGYRTGTQALRVNGHRLSANVSMLTPAAGDIIKNSNSGVSDPPTDLIYTGTRWIPLAGHVAAADAALVGGTATVANTSVKAGSVIRLAHKNRGGTPGAVYVSAITPGVSFTITSTSAADTSTVRWEVVSY